MTYRFEKIVRSKPLTRQNTEEYFKAGEAGKRQTEGKCARSVTFHVKHSGLPG